MRKLSLFAKFTAGISFAIILFGTISLLVVKKSVLSSLEKEFEKRGYFITRTLAEQSLSYLLTDDAVKLNMLINEVKAIDPTVFYAFIVNDKGEVLAHTFNHGIPMGIISANLLSHKDSLNIVDIVDADDARLTIRDFAMPIVSAGFGTVRVGIEQNEIKRELRQILIRLWIMIGFFFVFGVIGALFFFHTIAIPMKVLSLHAEGVEIKTIREGIDQIQKFSNSITFKLRKVGQTKDEIDVLFESYIRMLDRLEHTHQILNKMQGALMQTEKMAAIGTLTAGVAHEINNPLGGMRLCLDRMKKKPGDLAQTKEYIEMMDDALHRVENVIHDMLTYSRKNYLELEEVTTCDIIRKTVALANYRIKKSEIEIKVDRTHCPYSIRVSASRIEQVFLNLIFNAIDAIQEKIEQWPEHKGLIEIYIEDLPDKSHVVFKDNGTGIDEKLLSKIFDPFFTTKKIGQGTGLGLPVSFQIVKDHGGEIRVQSIAGKGSIFTVVLPKYNLFVKNNRRNIGKGNEYA